MKKVPLTFFRTIFSTHIIYPFEGVGGIIMKSSSLGHLNSENDENQ